jgi:hypothetical protein
MPMFLAVFMLYTAAGADFGKVTDPTPVDKATCEMAVNDADLRQEVADLVKQETGQDVIVRGICHPVE